MIKTIKHHCLVVLISAAAFSAPALAQPSGGYFAVIVSDLDTAATWYSETLGLSEVSRIEHPERFSIVNLARDGLFVELLKLHAAQQRPDGRLEGPFKLGLLVTDIEAFIATLPENMAPPPILDDERNNLRLLQLRDPDGNTIQVMQQLPEPDGG